MTIYLVRHGNYLNPQNIYPFLLPVVLSPEGIEQIDRVGQWFKDQSALELPIYTSPVKRCVQTAEIISHAIDSSITVDDRLIESRCPNLQGTQWPETEDEVVKKECGDPSRESSAIVQKRMLSIFNEKVKDGKDCILVSHGDPLTSLYYHLMKLPLVHCLFDNEHSHLVIKRAEIVKVEILEGNAYLVSRHTA